MKYSAHKFHGDLWHALLTVFANAIRVTAFWFNFIFVGCTNRAQNARCALETSNVQWNSIMELFDLIWFDFVFLRLHYITAQFGALIVCLSLKENFAIIPLYAIMMLNMVNYNTCNVCVAKHLNAWIHEWQVLDTHTQHTYQPAYILYGVHRGELMHWSSFNTLACEGVHCSNFDDDLPPKMERIKRFLSRTSWLCIGMQCLENWLNDKLNAVCATLIQ